MNRLTPKKRITFRKIGPTSILYCDVDLFDDGSAYVVGREEDIEIVFEFCEDAMAEATQYLAALGYEPCPET